MARVDEAIERVMSKLKTTKNWWTVILHCLD
jgi:hypothetical protein